VACRSDHQGESAGRPLAHSGVAEGIAAEITATAAKMGTDADAGRTVLDTSHAVQNGHA
jgi:hypothetical protein